MSYSFYTFLSVNKVAILYFVHLLNCTSETIQVTKGCRFFPRGPHVGHNAKVSQNFYKERKKQINIYIYTYTYGTLFGFPRFLKSGVLGY
jgi:hypothetical protein